MRNENEEMRLSLGKLMYVSHKQVPCMSGFLLREIMAALILVGTPDPTREEGSGE